ncbi:MAG: hypothetical protein F6K19_01745 [Cyanothece sp. SIO1E1]|nr:hypothetical protein [Cyanothece sp. SIO1E1]
MKQIALTANTGRTKVIGTYEDRQSDRMFIFRFAQNGQHDILMYDGKTVTDVLRSSTLGFTDTSYITDISVLGNILIWSDGGEVKELNLDRALSGGYTAFLEQDLYLHKQPPKYPLTTERLVDTDFSNNYISDKAFQFAARYRYEDGYVSVLGPISALSDIPFDEDSAANFIRVRSDINDGLPIFVKDVEVFAREGNSGRFSFIGKMISGSLDFRNDIDGTVLPDSEQLTSFNALPVKNGTSALLRNRIFTADTQEGYDSSNVTIKANTQTSDLAQSEANRQIYRSSLYSVRIDQFGNKIQEIFQSDSTFILEGGLYYTVTYFASAGEAYLVQSSFNTGTTASLTPDADGYLTGTAMVPFATATYYPNSPVSSRIFKSFGSYELGVVFMDDYGRHSGVCRNPVRAVAQIPKLNLSDLNAQIQFDLTSSPVSEIPDWATRYSIVRTPNLTADWFLQGKSADMYYIRKNEDGTERWYDTYSNANEEVYIDISNLVANNIGYTFQEGDRIKLFDLNSKDWDVEILRQTGRYLVVKAQDFGSFATDHKEALYEIYTPYTREEVQRFYEVGVTYPIINGDYSVKQGILKGDVSLIGRIDSGYSGTKTISNNADYDPYTADELDSALSGTYENMSPRSDILRWEQDFGRLFISVPGARSQQRPTVIRFSDAYVPGATINMINNFNTVDEYVLPVERGKVNTLVPTGDDVLLAIHDRTVTSLYVGKGFVRFQEGNTALVQTEGVIGDAQERRLLASYGTKYPESIAVHDGRVYFFDAMEGELVRYSNNGLTPVSSIYGMKTFFKRKGREVVNSDARVLGEYHPFLDCYVVTFTNGYSYGDYTGINTINVAQSNLLLKQSAPISNIYRLKIQGSGATIEVTSANQRVFIGKVDEETVIEFKPIADNTDIRVSRVAGPTTQVTLEEAIGTLTCPNETVFFHHQKEKFIGTFDYNVDHYVRYRERLYNFKGNDTMWEHEGGDDYGKIHGETKEAFVEIYANMEKELPKEWQGIAMRSSKALDINVSNDSQESRIKSGRFRKDDGLWYANMLRDMNTDSRLLKGRSALLYGTPLRSDGLKVKVSYNGNEKVTLDELFVHQQRLPGHLI